MESIKGDNEYKTYTSNEMEVLMNEEIDKTNFIPECLAVKKIGINKIIGARTLTKNEYYVFFAQNIVSTSSRGQHWASSLQCRIHITLVTVTNYSNICWLEFGLNQWYGLPAFWQPDNLGTTIDDMVV